jgi:hypothetical protein
MTYFKINGVDFSMYINKLKVGREHIYKGMTNAAGNLLVRYVNTKRIIEVGIIPLDSAAMKSLQEQINKFSVTISYLDPETGVLEENVACIIPHNSVDYYTVQAGNTKFKALSLEIKEL